MSLQKLINLNYLHIFKIHNYEERLWELEQGSAERNGVDLKLINSPRYFSLKCMESSYCHVYYFGGHLMVSALDSRWSSLGRDIVLCSWARQFILTVLLSTQVSKWQI